MNAAFAEKRFFCIKKTFCRIIFENKTDSVIETQKRDV